MMFSGTQKTDVDARWKSFRVVKAALQNLVSVSPINMLIMKEFPSIHTLYYLKIILYYMYHVVIGTYICCITKIKG